MNVDRPPFMMKSQPSVMPLDLVKRHILTMGSSHDRSVAAKARAGLCSNWASSVRNLGNICLARLPFKHFMTKNPFNCCLAKYSA